MSKATTRQSKGKRKVPVEPSDSNDKRIKISNDNPLNQDSEIIPNDDTADINKEDTGNSLHVPTTPVKHRKKRPGKDPNKTFNIAVSSRALFNLEEEDSVFHEKGLKDYIDHQVGKEDIVLNPGSSFPFIKALEKVNKELKKLDPNEEELFTVTLLSKNNAQVGIRLQKSIEENHLKVQRMVLTGGTSPVQYLDALKIKLFLTNDEKDVSEALGKGIPSAVMSSQKTNPPSDIQLRVAFDLDAVLFSDESENIFKEGGQDAFNEHEKKNRDKPLEEGPLKPFAMALGKMREKFGYCQECPIRTYLVTSRDAEVGERALKTLRGWSLKIDESFFMDGAPKDDILLAINPHIFFDDQKSHIDGARESGTPSGHVPPASDQQYNKDEVERAKERIDWK